MGGRAALLLVRVAAVVVAAAVLVPADAPTDVLGRNEERPTAIARARSRRTHHALQRFDLRPGAPIERADSYVELRALVGSRGPARLAGRTVERGAIPVLRTVDAAPDQLLIVGLDAAGRVRYSTSIPDPTHVRAEFADADGDLHGEVVERPSEIDIRVPADDRIVRAELYRMDGSADPIASFEVG